MTMQSLTRRRFARGLAAGAAIAALPGNALADTTVDLMLVLSADVSRSVDARKFRLQRDGYAAAIANPQVVRLIQAGPQGRIGLMLVEWADAERAAIIVDWQSIKDVGDAERFAEQVRTVPRPFMGRTSISTGIDFAMAQFAKAPFASERRVIDVSGDGTHNSGRDVLQARDEAVAADIIINGLAILSPEPLAFNPTHTHPPGGLLKYYEDNVIGGAGAFALAAEGFEAFGQLMLQKLIKEIAVDAAALPMRG